MAHNVCMWGLVSLLQSLHAYWLLRLHCLQPSTGRYKQWHDPANSFFGVFSNADNDPSLSRDSLSSACALELACEILNPLRRKQ